MPGKHKTILALKNLTKSFGDKAAVKKLSLEVGEGEIFGFLGPNGAGKTTAIRLILDVLRPDKGSIELFGKDSRRTEETHQTIGYMSGEMVLDNDLTGAQFLNFVNYRYGGGHTKRLQELKDLLQVDLNTTIGNYSRGNRQKVALISAMMHNPRLLILDEPTSGFDPLVQEIFKRLIKEYQADGGTVFMSSHILAEVQELCSRVAFIKDGELVGVRDVDEIKVSSTKVINIRATDTLLKSIITKAQKNKALNLHREDATSLNFSFRGDINEFIKFIAEFEIEDMTIEEPELDEVFIKYYRETGDIK